MEAKSREALQYLNNLAAAFLASPDGSDEENAIRIAYDAACSRLGFADGAQQIINDEIDRRARTTAEQLADGVRMLKIATSEQASLWRAELAYDARAKEMLDDAVDHMMQAHFRLTEAQAHVQVGIGVDDELRRSHDDALARSRERAEQRDPSERIFNLPKKETEG
jgi:hypothetical protein